MSATYLRAPPITRPTRVTEPTFEQEPIGLDDAKRQCRIPLGVADDDDAVRRIVISARQQVETDTGLICFTGSFTWKTTEFPYEDVLELPDIRPITAVASITYLDNSGATQTFSSSYYTFQASGIHQYVHLNYAQVWPVYRDDINGIVVTFTAGYASVALLPENLRQAVFLQCSIQWEDSLGNDTTKWRLAYENHIARLKPSEWRTYS
jgi:uncharacterized phiE125 gp8 family phage protein